MKVSVVIPTYQRPEQLGKAIKNVLDQTFQDFELNIISDGYHQETDEVMKAYEDHPKINYFSYPENKGGNFARNFGIKHSVGEYIAFLDDDDFWELTKLEKQVQILDENEEIGLVYTGKKSVYPDLNISYVNLPKETGDLSQKIFVNNYIGSTANVMIRKTILEEAGLFDEQLPSMQDRELWMRVCQVTQIGAVNEPLFIHMNEDDSNQISANYKKKLDAAKHITEKHAPFFEKNPELATRFKRQSLETVLRILQRTKDKANLKKYTKVYKKEYSDLSGRIFILTTKIPYKWLLKLRTLKN